ncbi:hypothetical protein Tco_0849594, partial [Tanacetum coccineum]
MDDPNITMEEYTRLEEAKARRNGTVYNWETATYGRIWDDDEVHNLIYVETEFPAIVFDDTLISQAALSCKPTISPLNDNEIDFRISFDESDDEDYTDADEAQGYSGTEFREAVLDLDTTGALQFQLGGVREFILGMGLRTADEIESAEFGAYWAESVRQIPYKVDLSAYWVEISSRRDFLGT